MGFHQVVEPTPTYTFLLCVGNVTSALLDMFTNGYRTQDSTNKTATEQVPSTDLEENTMMTNDTQSAQDNLQENYTYTFIG